MEHQFLMSEEKGVMNCDCGAQAVVYENGVGYNMPGGLFSFTCNSKRHSMKNKLPDRPIVTLIIAKLEELIKIARMMHADMKQNNIQTRSMDMAENYFTDLSMSSQIKNEN